MSKPAIVVIGYNRVNSLKRLLKSISEADYSGFNNITLVISLDKAVNENEVLEVANNFKWNFGDKIIRKFDERQGLRKHVIQCGDLSNKYESIIVLEDDLIVSPNFYKYTVNALDFYKNNDKIVGIALYSHEWNGYAHRFFQPIVDNFDTYMGQFSITWGQCWTKKSWNKFKNWYNQVEGKLKVNKMIPDNINRWSEHSWGKYFVNYIVDNDLYYVIPRISLTTNFSEIGQHAKVSDTEHQVRILESNNYNYNFAPFELAKKYNIFFENIDLKNCFEEKILKDGITLDLNGYGFNNKENKYLLSTLELPYLVIKEFGLQMRPIDINVIKNIDGKGIYLYDITVPKKIKSRTNMNIMKYELRGILNKELLKYLMKIIENKIIK